MKKNLISIMILALLIVNIVLTSIMMISVVNTNKKTAVLVTDVASAIKLDMGETGTAQEEEKPVVSMKNLDTYEITDMTIPLKKGEDGKDHYGMISVVLSMNKKNKDYKTYGEAEAMDAKAGLIEGEINAVISQYTMDEAKESTLQIQEEILSRLQKLFDSDFIFEVTLKKTIFS